MTTPQSRSDWQNYAPESIPTKHDLSHLENWLQSLPPPARLLDLGCGTGSISAWLQRKGYEVTGLDINPAAIEMAKAQTGIHFICTDIAAEKGLPVEIAHQDGIVCQLVISIIGDPTDRHQVLANAREALKPGGQLYLSASGVSDDLNPDYAAIYKADAPLTGEPFTYLSRDAEGQILYSTHHFTRDELQSLLQTTGYEDIFIEESLEASSRRPEQRARFYYATARRPLNIKQK